MPKVFRMRPKRDTSKFFRPPGQQQKKEQSPRYERACRIRSSKRWKDIRDHMVRHSPICERCGVEKTEDAHHIEPISESPDMAFRKDNILCVCKRCHETIHTQEKVGEDNRERWKRIATTR